MANQWFCRVMGEELGPMPPQQLLAMTRSGQLTREDLVRKGADGNWVRAENVKGLFTVPSVHDATASVAESPNTSAGKAATAGIAGSRSGANHQTASTSISKRPMVVVVGGCLGIAVLILAAAAVWTWLRPAATGVQPVGYYTSKSLQGGIGTPGGDLSPRGNEQTFLVVQMQVKEQHLFSRSQVGIYDPRQFTIVLGDGRGFRGHFIGFWGPDSPDSVSPGMGFAPAPGFRLKYASDNGVADRWARNRTRHVAVAWLLDEREAKPPLQIQFLGGKPRPVPNNTMVEPP